MEACPNGKDGCDACYVGSSSSPTLAVLRDDGDLRCTVRSEQDLDIVQLSSVQIKANQNIVHKILSSLPYSFDQTYLILYVDG
jgi:hypothetical protein